MSTPKRISIALFTTLLVTGLVGMRFEAAEPVAPDADKMAELFSPASVGGAMCGPAGQQRPNLLRQVLAAAAMGQAEAATDAADHPPLYSDLGTVTYAATSDSPMAQAYFDQGLRFAYAFNHAEAVRSFKAAQDLDPGCALCAWGEAYALGPNINLPMAPDAVDQALAAVERSVANASNASPREQALIAALATRYGEDAARRPVPYNTAFATAMIDVQASYPDDHGIALITADAVMNESPWVYWEPDGRTPAGRIGKAVALVEQVLADNPSHPGAIHLYIHLLEASVMPTKVEPYAEIMEGLMPGAGHMVHMPSHIYYRIGRYLDSLETNIEAVLVDEAYFQRPEAIAGGMYQYGYYPHNVHFVLVSAYMAGDRDRSLEYADKLDALVPMAMANSAPGVQPVKVSPLFTYAEFGAHDQVMALPDPGTEAPYVKAMWHYARAISLAKNDQSIAALAEVDAIAALNDNANFRGLTGNGVPAPTLLSIAQQVALGRIAQADDELDAAIGHFEAAVSLQDTVNYMEPPYWYYPVRQSLGAAYLAAGRPDDAERALKASLIDAPNNGLALFGLAEVYKAKGDAVAAKLTEDLLSDAWAGTQADLDMSKL
ncbi:MAG: tetratricopeptide repeat protein [Alphaproteobacteria bacterium]|nr:tetratricopeptide repeat protein [Alphaproteobacteria bacterium]